MKTEEQYFQEGQLVAEYMDNMSKLKEESFQIYNGFQVPQDGFVEQLKNAPLHFLIITEDWCGDAMLNVPIVRKVAEEAGKEVRVVLRDSNVELIDRHLTNGGRAIPIVLILNDDGQLVGKWGPRAPELQQLVDEMRASLPDKEDPTFNDKQKEMYKTMTRKFVEDKQLWPYVYESVKKKISDVI